METYYSPQWLYHFTFPPIVHRGSNLSYPCQYLLFCTRTEVAVLPVFNSSHSKLCEVISHRTGKHQKYAKDQGQHSGNEIRADILPK